MTGTDTDTFTIPVNVTAAGTTGTITTYPDNPKFQAIALHGDATLERYVHSDEVFWVDDPLQLPSTQQNIAPLASAWASSQDTVSQQHAVKAVDQVIGGSGGTPDDPSREWASDGEGAGAWLQLRWPGPVVIDQVTLYDRPNSNDWITSGTLTFSDGSTEAVGSLPNEPVDGLMPGLTVSFPAKVVTGLKFTIDTVGVSTSAIGLSEIQVRGQAWNGTFSVAGGAPFAPATTTLSSNVSGAQQMRFSNDGSAWSSWQAYSASASYTLPGSDGLKTVYAEYRGAGGDASAEVLALSDQVTLDTTPPVTTATGFPADWTKVVPQTVTLSASDAGSGLQATYYTINGGAQQTYSAPLRFIADGTYTVEYWSLDNAGNAEAHHSGVVKIDTHAPSTSASGLQDKATSGWRRTAQMVSFTTSGGQAPVTIYYTLGDSARHTYGGAFRVSGSGSHKVTYWSVDSVGNEEGAHTGYVNIDTTRPTTSAPYAASVHRGSMLTLKFKVLDKGPRSGSATVVIKIKTLKGKTVKSLRLTSRKVNSLQSYRFRCTLKKGTYRFYVYATDTAGNVQSKVAHNALHVR